MLVQILLNGIVSGFAYALVAFGFALIYSTTKIFHFAHGGIYTLAAYLMFTFYNQMHFPLLVAVLLSLTLSSILGVAIDELIYVPLTKRSSTLLVQMISSLGLYIVIVNSIALFYGNETKIVTPGVQPSFRIGTVILSRIQIATLLASLLLCLFLIFILKKTKLGLMIRAMRDNPELLSIVGVNPRMIRWFVFAMGSFLAAVPSILVGLDVGIDPNIGMSAFLAGSVSVIVGGVGVFEGAPLGALLLGLTQSLVIWKASARWQDAIAFLILILFLLFRPQGILGIRRRIDEATT
jgi:branched-chain amino acid transport system permease protein